MKNNPPSPRIFISYAWANREVADQIDNYFKSIGIELERDIRDIDFKGSIKEFMHKVTKTDFVIMLISKDFLESENCMYEAMEMFERKNFKDRLLHIVLEDANFYKPEGRLQYVKYWRDKFERLDTEYRGVGDSSIICEETLKDIKHFSNVKNNIDNFMCKVKDMNSRTLGYHLQNNFKDILEAIGYDDAGLLSELIEIKDIPNKDEQLSKIEEFLSNHPGNRNGLFTKAFIQSESKNYKTAIILWTNYLKKYPDDYLAWYNKGVDLGDIGNNREAIECYSKAIEIKPNYSEAWYNKGVDLGDIGNNKEAIECFNEAIRIKQDYFEAWYNKGAALGRLGKHEEAIECYNEAIRIKPDYSETWNNKGVALVQLGKHEEAIKCYDKAIEIKPDNPSAWYNKACTYSRLTNNIEMLKHLKRAIELDNKYKEMAKTDEDFKKYRDDPDFMELVK